jgi:energy-coupling factor transporter ATP-binding protein EcfA2
VSEPPPAIRLLEVSVCYRLARERVSGIKEFAIHWAQGRIEYIDLWALSGVSLEVRPGEILGIVGRNGAGKSTLLKTIARVLHPTSGRVVVCGRDALHLAAGKADALWPDYGFHAGGHSRKIFLKDGQVNGALECPCSTPDSLWAAGRRRGTDGFQLHEPRVTASSIWPRFSSILSSPQSSSSLVIESGGQMNSMFQRV